MPITLEPKMYVPTGTTSGCSVVSPPVSAQPCAAQAAAHADTIRVTIDFYIRPQMIKSWTASGSAPITNPATAPAGD